MSDVLGNWIHHNHGPGVWADTNDNDFLIEGNLIEGNDSHGIFYEISYNAVIRNNTLKNNAWVSGREFATPGDPFPIGAIYLSETDGPANTATCSDPAIAAAPLYTDCRWWTKNVDIHHNTFTFDPAAVDGGCPTDYCGQMALLANWGSYPAWSPYMGNVIQQAIMFDSNNKWHDNTYTGPWQFKVGDMGTRVAPATWMAGPYAQDTGSTFDGGTPTTTPPPTTTTTPPASSTKIAENDFEPTDHHAVWYAASMAYDVTSAHAGKGSLLFTTSEPWGSAIQLDNWPGYGGIVGGASYDFSLWYAEAVATMPPVTWKAVWRNEQGEPLRTDDIAMPRATDWTEATAALVAPAGATRLHWSFTWSASAAGPAFRVDDIQVARQ